jgi:hypothetical protein
LLGATFELQDEGQARFASAPFRAMYGCTLCASGTSCAAVHRTTVHGIQARPFARMLDAPWISRFVRLSGASSVFTWLKAFGHEMPKPTILITNMSNGWRLRRLWSPKRGVRAAHDFTKVVKHWIKGQSNASTTHARSGFPHRRHRMDSCTEWFPHRRHRMDSCTEWFPTAAPDGLMDGVVPHRGTGCTHARSVSPPRLGGCMTPCV